ncbi:hypothetical protein Pmani_038148 [Petrolisthes manimaculis]|uniref:E3 ubiquitin-protein ligase SHPRH n=1 Tax=Petrolisthes manimaculis TaxID=1843537 RepID=A0AAE1NGS3_9EUCA|nr:hypothetical protein Pmani_038148 [Petrolisthes manimaculis]
MVRNKPAPQQLNEVQQRRAQWNMLEGGGPEDQAGPADQAQGERPPQPQQEEHHQDDIQFLLNDELEDDSDDTDVEYIPNAEREPPLHQPLPARWGRHRGVQDAGRRRRRRRRVHFDSDSDDEVVEIPVVRRQRAPTQPDYGDFTDVLNRSQFYAKISRPAEKEINKNLFCCFGNVIVKLKDHQKDEQIDQIPGCEFWIYVSPEADQSAAYFEWTSGGSPKKKNQRKKAAENFCFFMIDGILSVEFWQGMSTQRCFELKLETFDHKSNEMTIGVYLKKGGLSELKHASESIQCPQSLGVVVSYFFGVEVTTYTGNKVMKHDLEELYGAVKELHADKEYCSLNVQHSSLIPQLRPYQKLAVKWMLYQEKFGRDTELSSKECDDLHCLYVELTSRDNQTFYFNKYTGFLVKNKPLAVLPTPGGILADEMGLGKTVEVLACMLCHPRQSVPKPEYQEPIAESSSYKRKKSRGQDIYTLDGENEESEVKDSVSMEESAELQKNTCSKKVDAGSDSVISSVVQKAGGEKTEDGLVSKGRGKRKKNNLKGGIKVHLPVPKDTTEDKSEVTKSGRPKRNATKFIGGYASANEESEEEEENYDPPEKIKKRCSMSSSSSSGKNNSNQYNVEKEISECSMWSAIESVIINESWEGNVKEYKKNGSYKEFRKFLRMRKKDPFYMMSNYERLLAHYKSDIAMYSAKDEVSRKTIQGFFDTRVEQKSYFECLCGSSEGKDRDGKLRMQCGACSLWQHAECVQYDVSDPYRGPYFCPHCWTQESPVISGATLIVSPSAISYQWVNEIMKHLKQKSIRMLVYKGVATQGYIQPRDLAKFDIVITTYETLSRELNYVDLPHSNSQLGRRFRHPKRFMATPSPLPCVEWWRVCLDEAQMVECVTTKTAEMALRLAAVNRWCVTGTPVQKTVNELQGLLMFLGVDPYWVPQWWNRCLFLPYCHGLKDPLHCLLAQYMWRNSKKDVINQIDIPQQTEEVHMLSFTRVEEHFYKRLHTECSYEAQQRLKKFPDDGTKLSTLDRPTLNSLLHPLLKLRQACNHPQIVKGQFMSMNRKTMTMEMLLENLIKKTKVEAEEAHRLLIASMNGLAAIHIIREEWPPAVEMYRQVLRSIQEHSNIKTDSLQRLHTLHNLAEVLEAGHCDIQPTLRDASLKEEAEAIRAKYLQLHPQQVATVTEECTQVTITISNLEKEYNMKTNWWLGALQSFNNDFVMEVRDEMLTSYSRFEEHKCVLFPVRTRMHLQLVLNAETKKLKDQRREMMNGVKNLQSLDLSSLLDRAIDCHLRPAEAEPPQCLICATHEFFEDYEKTLFSMQELKHSRTTGVSKETEDVKDKAQVFQSTRRGNWGQSEIERILRYLQTKSLERVEEEVYKDSETNFRILENMKKEFKNYRILWRAVFDSVSAMDEVNMATIRLRLRFPDEDVPQAKKKKDGDNLEKKVEVQRYILEPGELSQQDLKLKSDRIVASNDMKIKLGQLLYLQNLAKTDFGKDGGNNPEPCPICQGELGEKWAVLGCCHSFCMECMRTLSNRGFNGLDRSAIKCPMCRQPTRTKDISYVDTKAKEEEEIKVQGSLSTKVEGVARLMLRIRLGDPDAKVLVFSSWNDVLEVIADAFSQNGITYRSLHQRSKFHKNLASFKTNSQVTALLLPISSGANGLNIIEARHVILVEPILNPAAELQAVGRVHRIGQTHETTVHRFLVQDTIEERMHQILRHHHTDHTDQNTVTIGDLKKLFLHPEELELQSQLDLSSESGQINASSTTNSQNANNESSGSSQQGDGESSDGSGSSGVHINDGGESDGDACDDFYVGGRRTIDDDFGDGDESCNDSGVIEEETLDEPGGPNFGESNSGLVENNVDYHTSGTVHGEEMGRVSHLL